MRKTMPRPPEILRKGGAHEDRKREVSEDLAELVLEALDELEEELRAEEADRTETD